MVAILFVVQDERESQMAYKDLMTTPIKFKTFIIRGKNVVDRVKQIGITKVPTLYITSKNKKIEGYIAIKQLIDQLEQEQMNRQRTEARERNQGAKRGKPAVEDDGIDIEQTESDEGAEGEGVGADEEETDEDFEAPKTKASTSKPLKRGHGRLPPVEDEDVEEEIEI